MAIINFGSINIDHVYQVPHFVQPGETLDTTDYQILLGGKGANQSIALAKAGADVLHVGYINENDVQFKQEMIKLGINGRYIQCTSTASGHAIIQVTPNGENAIFIFGGANRLINAKDIQRALFDANEDDWVLLQNETTGTKAVLEQAKAKGLKVAFNPAPMTADIHDLDMQLIDLLIINEIEAAELAGSEHYDDIVMFIEERFAHGSVLLTLGKQGVEWFSQGDHIAYPAFSVDAVDTTAAGDTFIGFFLAHYQIHQQPKQALRHACAASAIAVTRVGAAPSIPTHDEVSQFLAEHG
ncbi:MAG: ribokinase [Alteromonadaceae bacterium]|nr:ribokinase [Alteromonadaceae bacterium]